MIATATSLISTCRYPAKRAIVGAARDQATTAVRDWRLPVSVDDAALVVSELVTNAIRISGPADRVILHLQWIDIGLVIGVWDHSTEMPELNKIAPDPGALEHDEDQVGGWGLPLVQAVTAELHVDRTYSPAGKWVTALLNSMATPTKPRWLAI